MVSTTKIQKKVRWRNTILLLLLILISVGLFQITKPLPQGISVEGPIRKASNVEFLYDLTYEKDGKIVQEQQIFDRVFGLIENAEKFIVIDMFLFNDDYNRKYQFPTLAEKLTNKLIEKKQNDPDLEIVFITDEINSFYGAYPAKYVERLESEGVPVITTKLTPLRDSNPTYSTFWRIGTQWFGTSGEGWLPNAFSPDSPKVTLRSYLKLLNFKANHRKVIATEKSTLICSANPHDASGNHSNIAFVLEGEIIQDVIASEKAVAELSDGDMVVSGSADDISEGNIEASLITEGKIRKHVLEAIQNTVSGDSIRLGMFYLSERKIIRELIKASERGVNIRLILDRNVDAFGLEKNGIPNRPVANELQKKSNGAIQIKWYNTHGEQFHSKLIFIRQKEKSLIVGGSANFTRRNIGDYNLETDVKIIAHNDEKVVQDVSNYFERLWNNEGGLYTLDYEQHKDESKIKTLIYRFQEWSGLSSF
ncbi:MAG: phospholipase D family protein [Bacillota bacterium]